MKRTVSSLELLDPAFEKTFKTAFGEREREKKEEKRKKEKEEKLQFDME